VHYFGPHERHDARLSFEESNAKMVREYEPLLAKTDAAVGRLLDALDEQKLADNSLVILHADHGQSLGEHYYCGHGVYLYDPTLRIPLLMRFPGQIPAGKRITTMTRNIDIFPTALELSGYTAPQGLDGTSLVAAIQGRSGADGETNMYAETYLSATDAFAEEVRVEDKSFRVGFVRRGVRTPDWLFVVNEPAPFIDYSNPPPVPAAVASHYRKEELFDLKNDPAQTTNVIGKHPDAETAMRQKLAAHLQTSRAGGARRDLDAAARERLRSLGYMD
jgi:arylsulfatase A-like enzyme